MDDDALEPVQPEPQPEPRPAPPPNPFVVPPPAPPAPPPRKSRRLRTIVITLVVVVAGLALIGHVGRGQVSATDLDAGMCIKEPGAGGFKQAHKVSCTSPHYAEIMGWVDDVSIDNTLTNVSEAQSRCEALFGTYAANAVDRTLYAIGFFAKSGAIETSDVLCFVKSASGALLTQPVAATT